MKEFDAVAAFDAADSPAHAMLSDRQEEQAHVINRNARSVTDLQAYVLALEARIVALEGKLPADNEPVKGA